MSSNGSAIRYANPEQASGPALPLRPAFRPPRDRVHALLLESDPRFRDDLAAVLRQSKQLDVHLTVCRSVEEIETALWRDGADVIYLDYWFGEETSVAFIHALAARGGTPCVMVTALDEPDIRRIAFRAGVRAFLSRDALNAQALDSVTLAVLRPRFASAH